MSTPTTPLSLSFGHHVSKTRNSKQVREFVFEFLLLLQLTCTHAQAEQHRLTIAGKSQLHTGFVAPAKQWPARAYHVCVCVCHVCVCVGQTDLNAKVSAPTCKTVAHSENNVLWRHGMGRVDEEVRRVPAGRTIT